MREPSYQASQPTRKAISDDGADDDDDDGDENEADLGTSARLTRILKGNRGYKFDFQEVHAKMVPFG